MTGATESALDDRFYSRRLCDALVVNIAEPVGLHELVLEDQPLREEATEVYEQALSRFEAKDFASKRGPPPIIFANPKPN